MGLRANDVRHSGGPEHLLKVQRLPLVRQIQNLIRVEIPLTLHHGGKLRGIVQHRAVALNEDARGHFLLVPFLRHRENQRAVAFHREALGFEIFHHIRDIGIGVAFAQPGLKMHVQILINPAHIGNGRVHNVPPQCPITRSAALQFKGYLMGFFGESSIHLAPSGSSRINFLQLPKGKGRLLWVRTCITFVKIREFRLLLLQARNDQTHLQSPVSQVHVANHTVTKELINALYTFTNDSGAQMTDMQRLRHIRSAIVDDNGFCLRLFVDAKIRGVSHFLHIGLQKSVGQLQVNKAGLYYLSHGKIPFVQPFHHSFRNDKGRLMVSLCRSQRAVALELAQIRAVGNRNGAIAFLQADGFKSGGNPLGY